MNEEIQDLLVALNVVAEQMPTLKAGLSEQTVPAPRLLDFAKLLIGLGELLREHALAARSGDSEVAARAEETISDLGSETKQ
jgi:hypothetical protein